MIFVVFEGIDGSGKSTQAKLLAEHLRKKDKEVLLVEEPGGTSVGDVIREVLLDKGSRIDPLTELLLYEASRSQLVQEVIKPALEEGKVVIADRYSISSLAYQGYGRGIDLKLIKELNKIATAGLEPDMVFLLDLPAEEGLVRVGRRDRIESAEIEFHHRVRRGYLKLIAQHERGYLIDGRKGREEVFQEVLLSLKEVREEV